MADLEVDGAVSKVFDLNVARNPFGENESTILYCKSCTAIPLLSLLLLVRGHRRYRYILNIRGVAYACCAVHRAGLTQVLSAI